MPGDGQAGKPNNRVFSQRRSAALEFLCICLSSSSSEELENRLGATGKATDFNWKNFINFATDHLVAPAVAYHFDRCGLAGGQPH